MTKTGSRAGGGKISKLEINSLCTVRLAGVHIKPFKISTEEICWTHRGGIAGRVDAALGPRSVRSHRPERSPWRLSLFIGT